MSCPVQVVVSVRGLAEEAEREDEEDLSEDLENAESIMTEDEVVNQ